MSDASQPEVDFLHSREVVWLKFTGTVSIRAKALGSLLQIGGTPRQFLEYISSEDYLRSRIFGTFVVKFIACLSPLLGFSNIQEMV